MQVGMNLPVMVPGLDRGLVLEWARRVDRGPFSSLAAGERITFPNPEMLVTLAAAAAVTERVRIVPTVMVLPLHSAVWAAKQIATLDVMSGGRVVLGVGAGARQEDFRAVGAQFEGPRLQRLEEQVADACDGQVFEDLVARVRTRELDPHAAAAELIDATG